MDGDSGVGASGVGAAMASLKEEDGGGAYAHGGLLCARLGTPCLEWISNLPGVTQPVSGAVSPARLGLGRAGTGFSDSPAPRDSTSFQGGKVIIVV